MIMMSRSALILLLARSWSCLPSASAWALVPPQRQGSRGFPSLLPTTSRSRSRSYTSSSAVLLLAKPKKAGSTVDNYQTVSVNCSKCQQRLFRYKKKNGTKSNLVKCYIERISEDSAGVLALAAASQEASQSAPATTSVTTNDKVPNHNNKKNTKKRKRTQTQKSNALQSSTPNTSMPEDSTTTTNMIPTQLDPSYSWECPNCHTQFARSSMIHGRPALKLVGGKIRMTKK